MVHGPCGGVGADGSCEIGGPCAFVSSADQPEPLHLARASGEDASSLRVAPRAQVDPQPLLPGARAVLDRLLDPARPFVVADLPSPTADAEQDRALASRLAGSVDAVLLGDAPWARVMLPPAVRGWNVAREGVTPWCGVNARDRNRVALESEVAGLAAIGVPAMHSVTGDHPNLGHRPDAKPVFDLDSTELAALAARTTGLLISVAESPAAVPTKDRAARAAMKLSTGARVLFVNHCAPERLAEFAAELVDVLSDPTPAAGAATQPTPGEPTVPLIACIPLIPTRASADRIAKYLHADPPPELLDALDAPDPITAAIALAVQHAERVLEIPGVVGVDLSAPAGPGEAHLVADALATAGRALGASA